MYDYNFKLSRVIDGDTIVGHIDLGFGVVLKDRVIRLHGINTPELRSKNLSEKILAQKAKQFVIDTLKGKDICLMSIRDKKGSFGRILGNIYFKDAAGYEEELAMLLIAEKLAVPYVANETKVNKRLMRSLIENSAL
tara:strand:+ start:1936 stop:2346 length:411 start_codon:yes stop_codon:yes gene_type:complete